MPAAKAKSEHEASAKATSEGSDWLIPKCARRPTGTTEREWIRGLAEWYASGQSNSVF